MTIYFVRFGQYKPGREIKTQERLFRKEANRAAFVQEVERLAESDHFRILAQWDVDTED